MKYEIYYDRGTKCWWAFWMDDYGNQASDAVHAATKDMCLIYLGMSKS